MKNQSNGFAPIPIASMKWKKIENFELNTPLGLYICLVEIADISNYVVLKPGEETRIRKAQVVL